ncbi:MAG: TIM barrel protein [Candidatus Helarchaeota archaeon]
MVYDLIDLRYQRKVFSPEEMVKQLKTFKLKPKFSMGIWYVSPVGGRFHDRYVPNTSIEERIESIKNLKEVGISGIEAHYPDEINWDNIDLFLDLKKSIGIKVVGVAFSHFFDKKFEFGSLSNPYPEIRKEAINIAIEGLKLVKEIGANFAISWPGIDGYTYFTGTFYNWMWDNFENSMAQAMDAVPGVRIAIEPKPYEPIPNNIYRTTAEGILAATRIEKKLKNPENKVLLDQGRSLVALNPEIGHVRMGFEPLAAAFSLIGKHGKLAHTHWNSQPLGNYDQDLNVGVVGIEETYALLYSLKQMGYEEFFGIDIFPERMPYDMALKINIDVIKKMISKIDSLPHEEIINCYLDPVNNRGKLEKILMKYII